MAERQWGNLYFLKMATAILHPYRLLHSVILSPAPGIMGLCPSSYVWAGLRLL